MSYITVKDLSFSYDTKKRTDLLKSVSFSISAGESVALAGTNGSGKTTLMKILATVLRPTSGAICLNDVDVLKQLKAYRRQVNLVVGGSLGFYPRLTGIENLQFFSGLRYNMLNVQECQALLDKVGLSQKAAHQKFFEYSLGMRQRLHIAKLFMEPNELLLIDEITNGLDDHGRDHLICLLNQDLKNKTKLIISHDREFLNACTTRSLVLSHGVLTEGSSS